MDRRRFVSGIVALSVSPFAAPLPTSAQATKIRRIGLLSVASGPSRQTEALRDGLREHGFVEGLNLNIEYRWAADNFDRLDGLAVELTRQNVEVIVAVSTWSAVAAKRATTTTPIVFTSVADPIGSGLVSGLARPGGNITGLATMTAELGPKRLEILKEALPEVAHVGALWHPDSHGERRDTEMVREVSSAARTLGVRLRFVEARVPEDLDRAYTTLAQGRVGAVILLSSPMFVTQRRRIANLAARHRLPTVHSSADFVEVGGFMAYGQSSRELHRRAAIYVDKILKGAKPGDLPVEQPTKLELVINLKTAKALGLTIPPALLARADHVIE